MNKKEIIEEIKRSTVESNGKAPGMQRFTNETGIRKSDWYPHLWLRWSDAIIEAGFEPNTFNESYDIEFLIIKYIDLIRELGHFPLAGELKIKNKSDSSFPSHNTFSQLGPKQERIKKITDYCENRTELKDIISICKSVKKTVRELPYEKIYSNLHKLGYVYIIKHGSRNEYKIGKTFNPMRREGELRLELPEKVQPIHYIKTDDPTGIENYWHARFSTKRKEGEWFSLTKDDVNAFKRWRKIY